MSEVEAFDPVGQLKYWAFISYSTTDKKWADWLHKALETYRVPKDLVGRVTREDSKIPRRLFPIFRDRDELSSSADLSTAIRRALMQSRYLIIICSPRAAHSRWVDQEIRQFKQARGEDRVLCIIVDGEPHAASKPGLKEQDECFPPAVRFRVDQGAQVTSEPAEPLAADLRHGGDGKQPGLLKLVAGILQVSFDDLLRRDQRRRALRAKIVAAISLALLVVFGILSILLFLQLRATRALLKQASEQDYNVAHRLIMEGDPNLALNYLGRSIRYDPKNELARIALGQVLLFNQNSPFGLAAASMGHKARVDSASFSPDGRFVVTASADDTARVWEAATGKAIGEPIRHEERLNSAAFSPDGKLLLIVGDNTARVWEVATGKAIGEPLPQPLPHADSVYRGVIQPGWKTCADRQ